MSPRWQHFKRRDQGGAPVTHSVVCLIHHSVSGHAFHAWYRNPKQFAGCCSHSSINSLLAVVIVLL